jgi:hypothetical protein
MTTNSTWTTVNGMVMPGSGTQTFSNDCFGNPFGMAGMMPGFGGCGIPGMAGFGPPPAFYIDNSGNMWVPCGCEQGTAAAAAAPAQTQANPSPPEPQAAPAPQPNITTVAQLQQHSEQTQHPVSFLTADGRILPAMPTYIAENQSFPYDMLSAEFEA